MMLRPPPHSAIPSRSRDRHPARARGQPRVRQRARSQIRTARSESRVAFGEYTPSIFATLLGAQLRHYNAAGIEHLAERVLRGTQRALTNRRHHRRLGREADRTHAAADLCAAAQAQNVAQRYAVTLSAQSAFYGVLRASDLVDVARASVDQAQQGLRYAQDRVRAEHTATRSDELRAQLQVTTSRLQLVAALDTLQTAAYALGRLVGANGPVGGKPPASLEPRDLSMSDSDIVRLALNASSRRAGRAVAGTRRSGVGARRENAVRAGHQAERGLQLGQSVESH